MRTTDEISVALDELDKRIILALDNLSTVEEAKHEAERKVEELTETIRQGKHNLKKLYIEQKGLEREKWTAIKREKFTV